MKTLVFADLHLGTADNQDKTILVPWIESVVEEYKPQRVILAGDVFGLILPIDHKRGVAQKTIPDVLRDILNTWQQLFTYWAKSDIQEFILIAGEHDYEIEEDVLISIVKEYLPNKKVSVNDLFYDEESRALVLHGNQFDYNRIFKVKGEKVFCTEGLTVAINNFVSQTPEIEERVRVAAEKGNFSYWYAFGKLPAYIRATYKIFDADPRVYTRECAHVLRGGELDRWLAQQTDWATKAAGSVAKAVALFPPALLWFYDLFYWLLDEKTQSRMKKVLLGKVYTDEPVNLVPYKQLRHLITGHFHEPREKLYGKRTIYNISSPRLHISGIKSGVLNTFRDFDFIFINGDKVVFTHQRTLKDIPISDFSPTRQP